MGDMSRANAKVTAGENDKGKCVTIRSAFTLSFPVFSSTIFPPGKQYLDGLSIQRTNHRAFGFATLSFLAMPDCTHLSNKESTINSN